MTPHTDTLRNALETQDAPADGVRVFWLGHAGISIKGPAGQLIHIDPYLSNSLGALGPEFDRIQPVPIDPSELFGDVVICTHNHGDHLDRETIEPLARAHPNTTFVTPVGCAQLLAEAGVARERITTVDVGDVAEIAGATISGVYTDHELFYVDGPFQLYGAASYIVEIAGVRVFYLGDSGYAVQHHAIQHPDLLVAPINGIFHLPSADDLALMARATHARAVMPVHYGVCKGYVVDPQTVIAAVEAHNVHTDVHIIPPGGHFACHKQAAP